MSACVQRMSLSLRYTGGNCAESLSITSTRDSAYFAPHLKIKLGGIKPSGSPALLGASTAVLPVIITPPIACQHPVHPATSAAKTMEVPPPPNCSLAQELQSLDDVPQARTSRSSITLPPRNSAGSSSTTAAAGCCYEQRLSSGNSSSSGPPGAAGGALMRRRALTCIAFGGIVVGINADLTAGMTGNTFRPQQDRHSDGSIPALKTCALLPFLMRGPRVNGSPPVRRFSAYSCRDSATLPDAMY